MQAMKNPDMTPERDREGLFSRVSFAAYRCIKSSRGEKSSRSSVRAIAPKIRKYRALAAGIVAAGALAASAAPANAAVNPANVGCYTGSSCFIELSWQVTYGGSSGGDNGVVVTPPPCIGFLFGNAHVGSQAIISLLSNNTAPVAQPSSPAASPVPSGTATASTLATPDGSTPTPTASATTSVPSGLDAQERAILSKAEQLVNTNPMASGNWYRVTGNPSATTAAQQQCNNLPPYIWEAGASNVLRVDGLNVPPVTLAGLAYSQLNLAKLATANLDPRASDTNLPTFIEVPMVAPPTGALSVTAKGDPYVWASAQTPTGEAATVWAWVTGLSINPGTTNATTFDQARCSQAHLSSDGHTYVLGSRYSSSEMSNVGVDQKIDCGVTYTAPGTYHLTASITWNACWKEGLPTTDGPPAGCRPVPGAGGLTPSTTAPVRVNVRDIQSVNNG